MEDTTLRYASSPTVRTEREYEYAPPLTAPAADPIDPMTGVVVDEPAGDPVPAQRDFARTGIIVGGAIATAFAALMIALAL